MIRDFFKNAIRRISNEHVCCGNSVAYQKRNQTQEGEINYENTKFKIELHSKYPCYYYFSYASSMSMVTSSTQILINNLVKLIN